MSLPPEFPDDCSDFGKEFLCEKDVDHVVCGYGVKSGLNECKAASMV